MQPGEDLLHYRREHGVGDRVRGLSAVQEGRRAFGRALEEAERIPIKLEQPEIRRWHAKMLIERGAPGDRARARELLDEAIEAYRALGMPRHVSLAIELQKG